MIHLLFAVHNHQPVGNFDFIFERAYGRAYRPFLEVLKAHPGVRVSIHYSGVLIDWLEKHHPEYLSEVRELCLAGRVEVLGGAYYEPILPMLTESDRSGQIEALSDRVESLFGSRPRGMWLAERVWEPSLVSSIADAGIEYVVLDGSHFKMIGKGDADLDGHFLTEDQGRSLRLLPIHDDVRDQIPFRPVEDVVDALRALDAPGRDVHVVFGDDGEKFGEWPETYDTVYTHGWLDRFFSAMEAEPRAFDVRTLAQGIDGGRCLGLVYLPPASYQEMLVWAQNPPDIPRFRDLRRMLRDSGRGDDAERFVRGTFWRNFLVKYPESNRMHKQALRLSRAVAGARLPPDAAREARDHVWQAQCNCAYWHGVFGGLYLPHLRFAIYRHLIAAQSLLDRRLLARRAATWERTDWNFDGRPEHLLNTRALLLGFTADGAVDQFWIKRAGLNLCDTLTRRREAYHAQVESGGGGGTKLEDQIKAKEGGLSAHLVYDRRLRETLSEWVLPADTAFSAYRAQTFEPLASIDFGEPACRLREGAAEIRFEGRAALPDGTTLAVTKIFRVTSDGRSIETRWRLRAGEGPARFRLAAESLFCLLAGDAPDRYLSWAVDGTERRAILATRGEIPAGPVRVADEWLGFRAAVHAPGAEAIWLDAIETVSQSEGGYERVYQGTAVVPVWDADLGRGETAEFGIRIEFEEDGNDGQQGA